VVTSGSSVENISFAVPASTSTVPLPASVWLLGGGVLGFGFLGRRKN
jgi:hypothetical protein